MNKEEFKDSVRALGELAFKLDKKYPGCWKWKGKTMNGEGFLLVNENHISAQRISYQLFNSDFNEVKEVYATCEYCFCVKPEHLKMSNANAYKEQYMNFKAYEKRILNKKIVP